MAVAAPRRRADGDEHRVRALDRLGEIGGEAEAPGGRVAGDDLVEARLVDRDLASLQARDLAVVLVDAGDFDAEFGKARARNQADIAGADDRNAHSENSTRRN